MTDRPYAAGPGWVVFGAGGHARAVVDVLERRGESVVAVVGDAGEHVWHVECLGDEEAALARVAEQGLRAVVAIGAVGPRMAVIERVRTPSALSIVAVTATVSADVELGAGTVVLEHAHVGPGSRVGSGVIVNTGAIVEHDCVVGDGVHLAPAAVLLGAVSVGDGAFIGSGARVLPGVSVGAAATVGAGAVVTRDVADRTTVAGVPARTVVRKGRQ